VRFLLDTHAVIWWFADDVALSRKAHAAISGQDAVVFVSAASIWEIATKHRIGKLPHVVALLADLDAHLTGQRFIPLDITLRHAHAAGSLPGPHRDPFNRLLIAQALAEGLTLVSNERVFDGYGVERVW
jgi:PIN domain nuclease of toxin-antitoxin system